MGYVRKQLKEATREIHEQLHVHPLLLPLSQDSIDLDGYRAVLVSFHYFYQDLHRLVATSPYGAYTLRAELDHLEQDMACVGVSPLSLSRGSLVVDISSENAMYGVYYVIFGSRLGGQMIAKRVSRSLGLTPNAGLSFFVGDGAHTVKKWTRFVEDLELHVHDVPCCVKAAEDVFRAFSHCLWHCYNILRPSLRSRYAKVSS